jgi:hypothetical protein
MKPPGHPEVIMTDLDRAFGAEMSVHLIKVCTYFHYKAIPHQRLLRNACREPDASYAAAPERATLALIPDAAGCLAGLPA